MANRATYLLWVLRACELTDKQEAVVRSLLAAEPRVPPIAENPTMVHGPPADKLLDLGIPTMDGLAHYIKSEDRVYVSLANHGWVPLTDEG